MATQFLTVATVAGASAKAIFALFRSMATHPDPAVVDQLCAGLQENGHSLPVVYFCKWVDHWLMGDLVPGPAPLEGKRYQMACISREQALAWAGQRNQETPEEKWLAARLREAAGSWSDDMPSAVVVIREIIGPSTTDNEVRESLGVIPDWLPVRPTS